jgi:acyl-coenzyme A thioesterase PaaI-like protein
MTKLFMLIPGVSLTFDETSLHDRFCFACGDRNRKGLRLTYSSEGRGHASTEFDPDSHHQSYSDTLHGGIQSLLLDACMIQALKTLGTECITGKLEIRYEVPVQLRPVALSATAEEQRGDFFIATATLQQDAITKTTARGIYKKRPMGGG